MGQSDLFYIVMWGAVIYVLIEWYPPLGYSLAAIAGALMISKYSGRNAAAPAVRGPGPAQTR